MSNMGEVVDNYCQIWDVEAPDELIDEVFAPEVVDHNPQPGQASGIEGVKSVIAVYQAAFPDIHLSNDDIIISGDRAALRWSATGAHEGDQLGVPATHQTIKFTGIDILRIENARIVERWGEANSLEVMQQIQAI